MPTGAPPQTSLIDGMLEVPRALRSLTYLVAATPVLPVVLPFLPKGDSHPVLVLPGMFASDATTAPLRAMLRAFGYRSLGWGMGRNFGPSDAIQDLPDIVKNMSEEAGCKVSLIGWSLGGIYAREIARVVPDAVRRVITLGSSFNLTTRDQVAFARHYRSYELQKTGKYQLGPYNMTAEPLPVPSTAIYTRDDGFVPWQTTVQKPNERNENVEVRGSHLGLGVNPAVLYAICDRLAQAEGAFSPFEPPLLCRLWYPQRPVTAADFDVEKRS